MSKDTDYIANLVEYTVADENERVDLEACLEIADRANSNKPECLEVIKSVTKCLGKSNPKVVVNTLQLLETLCKNCNMRFLYELNSKKLVDALLKVIVRRRDRAKYGSKASKTSNPLKIEAEDRVLYLIQLWADTFMMHQTEFRNIHEAYRNLRKDGVQFPEREASQRIVINFQGTVSPVFLAMESNYIVPSNNQGGPVSDPNKKSQQSFKPKPVQYKHESTSSSAIQNTLYDENDDESEYNPQDGIQITREEVKILEESIGILREIERTAMSSADMKGDIAKEILSDLVHVHKRLKRFLKTEKFASASQKNEAIRLSQVLSNCLSSYKTKYYKLKEEQKRRIRTEPDEEYRADFQEDFPSSKNIGRLATEYDESNYAAKMKLSQDIVSNPLRGGKANPQPKGFEAPNGWKTSLEVDRNLNGNPDLVDLLNARDAKEAGNKSSRQPVQSSRKVEERKEERLKTQGEQNLVNDLLDFNFNTEPTQNISGGAKPSKENKKFASPGKAFQMVSPKFSTIPAIPAQNTNKAPVDLLDLADFAMPTANKQTVPVQNTQNFASTKATSNDDDDFFNDIANRKK